MIDRHVPAAVSLAGVILDCVLGALLVLAGFALQSLQYWATLLSVEVR